MLGQRNTLNIKVIHLIAVQLFSVVFPMLIFLLSFNLANLVSLHNLPNYASIVFFVVFMSLAILAQIVIIYTLLAAINFDIKLNNRSLRLSFNVKNEAIFIVLYSFFLVLPTFACFNIFNVALKAINQYARGGQDLVNLAQSALSSILLPFLVIISLLCRKVLVAFIITRLLGRIKLRQVTIASSYIGNSDIFALQLALFSLINNLTGYLALFFTTKRVVKTFYKNFSLNGAKLIFEGNWNNYPKYIIVLSFIYAMAIFISFLYLPFIIFVAVYLMLKIVLLSFIFYATTQWVLCYTRFATADDSIFLSATERQLAGI